VLFRSLRRLARRGMFAGVAGAVALTAFNVAQPSLGGRRIQPGTVREVQLALAPAAVAGASAPAPAPGSSGAGKSGAPTTAAASGPSSAGKPAAPTTAPASGSSIAGKPAAPATAAAVLDSPAVAVGQARFVGFSWPSPAGGAAKAAAGGEGAAGGVWLRTRSAKGWSGWREVEPSGDGPDPGSREHRSGRAFSDGVWLEAGTTDLQVRVQRPAAAAGAAPASGLAAHLVTPDMTATPGTEPPRPGEATAMTTRPGIISRARWGANESLRRHAPEYSDTVKAAFVHHTVQSNSYSPSESAALIRADYLYHVRSRGWNDIGYNFLVDRYGRVFEGRYGGVTRPVLGAHSGGFNTDTTGVALLGTFTTSRPPARMVAALQRLLAWKLDLTHVDPLGLVALTSAGGANTRYPAGRRVAAHTILGHRSTSYTTCPGDPVIGLLRTIRSAVSRTGRPKIYGGAASASLVKPEEGGSVGVHARFSSTARWRVGVTDSSGANVRSWAGTGAAAKVRWNGRTASGQLVPAGWATIAVTAAAGGATARPATSRVFVERTPPPSGTSTGGFSAGAWSVNNVNAEQRSTTSDAFASYRWGKAGDIPVVGDWDGDGIQTVGVVRPSATVGSNHFLLRNTDGSVADFWYGAYGDRPVVGDWNGDGVWTPGAVRAGVWRLRNSNTGGAADVTFQFGRSGDRYLTGDWDGDGDFTPAVQRAGTFWFRNATTTGPSHFRLRFGRVEDLGFAGDWNGNGTWTPGVLRDGAKWYLKDSFTGSAAGLGLRKQTPGTPVVGDWDGSP
jgi:N-acetylmuramoyl-L-alanine amidase